ncbi:hypothetical protein [Noviherbaspirillum sp.]|uniref:hypothetical protein n=1 Tax=Noviherbaspirillum sp. TaxID=1926288 RepID=UPI002B479ED2|nr:hypothetical protein [Noviherbaspirillum sp.]HJV80187.1 hypothetical protein [Noviherbaspirillum sp.]
MQPKIYISYSPGKLGSVFALFYFESGDDIYGWHIEARGLYFSAAFLMAEHFYANRTPHLYRSVQDDVYGPWTIDYPPTRDEIRCPVPESVGHELERAQSRFVEEWLFFKSDGDIEADESAYRTQALPVQEVNVKARRLLRMVRQDGVWTFMTPGLDINIVQFLRKYWRLCEKVPAH